MTIPNGDQSNKSRALSNEEMARTLEAVAELLDGQHANPYRTQAYRTAAVTLRNIEQPVREILETQGLDGLIRLPGIGHSIAHSLEQMAHTGRLNLLERLKGTTDPERVLATVPTIGDRLAHLIHEQLGIETLAQLQEAAYDGRLATIPGFGRKRLRAVRESLRGRLLGRQPGQIRTRQPVAEQPSVVELLDVDREYLERARRRDIPRIAPRRFNPTHEAWLPILHTVRGRNHYTALFSNTARAHELNMIHDWVVIYRDDEQGNGQWTVVTSQFGPLRGRRIVRGREKECRQHYLGQTDAESREPASQPEPA